MLFRSARKMFQYEKDNDLPHGDLSKAAAVETGNKNLNKLQQDRWDSIQLYNKAAPGEYAQRHLNNTGLCARGTVHVSKQVFAGNPYFDKQAVEGHGNANDATHRSFFEQSGLYHNSRKASNEELALLKNGKVPYGTVVTYEGGGGHGHSQIYTPHGWVSDLDRKSTRLNSSH